MNAARTDDELPTDTRAMDRRMAEGPRLRWLTRTDQPPGYGQPSRTETVLQELVFAPNEYASGVHLEWRDVPALQAQGEGHG